MFTACTRSVHGRGHGRVHGRRHGACTQPSVYTACTRPCTRPSTRPVHSLLTTVYTARKRPYTAVQCAQAMHIDGRLHGRCTYTAVHTCTWPVHGCVRAVYKAMYTTVDGVHRPCARLVYTAVSCTRPVHGREYGLYTAVYTYSRPVYETYRMFNFFTNSCDYIGINKAKHHIACHRKVIKYGVKRDLG